MRSVTVRLDDIRNMILNIGFVGENEHTRVIFDAKKMFDQYPHASVSMTVCPPEGESYPAVIERDGDLVVWDVVDSNLTAEGSGEYQLSFTEDPHLAKTYIGKFKVSRSIMPTGEIPTGIDDFLTRAGAALTAIPETIDAALEAAKESGEFDGPPGADGRDGADGYSPSASVTKSGSTATITITDKVGTTTAEVSDGADGAPGQDGAPGADGYSPTASVSKSGKVATITITDKNGTTTATVSDGADGTDIIDDTAGDGDTDKTWSANKIYDEFSDVLNQIDAKQDAPETAGTAGQVLSLDSNLDPIWTTPSGGGEVTAQQMSKCALEEFPGSANLWNPSTMQSGFVGTNGVVSASDSYVYNFVDVKPGDKIYCSVPGSARNMRFICAYDSTDAAQSTKGSGSDTNGFTVPDGIVKVAISVVSGIKDTVMIILNDAAVSGSYIAYANPYYAYVATDNFLKNVNAMTESYFQSEYMETVPKNILNPSDPDCVTKKLIVYSTGELIDSNDYYTTGFMPVVPGRTYTFWSNTLAQKGARAIAAYGSSKVVVAASGVNDGTSSIRSYTVPNGIYYIRISFPYRTDDVTFQPSGNMVIAALMPDSFMAYTPENAYIFKEEYIPEINKLHVYLPNEICVGVGRTIELYDELVCLEAKKYHLHYVCSKGVQYDRKFSITGATAGEYPLQLQIYDDNMKMVWTCNSTVKVVSNNIASELKILPIGDSLTNLKPWLGEVQTLSNSKILYIGTRGRGDQTIRCEGRSGFTAAAYNADTEYTFDNNYQGNPNVSGSVNPFWDGSKFSLSYYNTQQAATVGTADAVQLFLGTNDVFGGFTAAESAQHIKDLVDAIRAEFSTIPIFVCNTIYRSNQSGYYSSGGQGFSAASGWAFDSDMKIMNFQNALTDALKSYTNLYIVPLSVCMDREYDYGVNEVDVNPRLSTVKEVIPTESVHPQDPGYYQMADVMYSSFIAHLT